MTRGIGALLTTSLMVSSAWADVIPSRRPEDGSREARRQVSERLQAIGIKQDQAVAQANDLLDREARYFAEGPDRIQVVGDEQVSGFPTAAMVEGFLMLGLLAGGIVWRANVSN
jgi:hypothetical protein